MYGAAIVPYQGGPDIRLAPSALPFYPVGRSGQHDICLWRKNIGRFDEPRRDRCQPHIIIHVVAGVPFLWERCCQNTLLGVNYTLCKHGFQQAIVLKHHHHSASLYNSCDLYCNILPNFYLHWCLSVPVVPQNSFHLNNWASDATAASHKSGSCLQKSLACLVCLCRLPCYELGSIALYYISLLSGLGNIDDQNRDHLIGRPTMSWADN